jgi:serine protease AprX
VRQSALWGSGNRGGEHRSSALWGKGGRGIATTVLALALALPLAAVAASGQGNSGSSDGASYVSSGLKNKAKSSPNELVSVIVMSDSGADEAEKATKLLGKLEKRLGLIDGVAVELRAREIDKLERIPGLTITENAPVRPQGYTSSQLWPHESGVTKLWTGPKAPAIAIVDSGIDATRADFLGRVIVNKSFVTSGVNSTGDGRGHGTFVAGIAAGSAAGYAGASPSSDLVSLDVLGDNGSGLTSDVIAAAEWIHLNHKQYNIRVANFSLHSGGTANFYNDPLDRAVEKLWFDGIVVVAAVGNYGLATGPSGVKHAPGNDPFVISVGAVDIGGTSRPVDDANAPWSAYGYTRDGFMKPEICAPGRYMVGPIPALSTLAAEKASKLQGLGYIELSGTSFAAPVVSGVAAQLLARNPSMTPDQVKGTLMRRARPSWTAPRTRAVSARSTRSRPRSRPATRPTRTPA